MGRNFLALGRNFLAFFKFPVLLLIALSGNLGGMLIGMMAYRPLEGYKDFLIVIKVIGFCCGANLAGWFADTVGRKFAVVTSGLLFLTGWLFLNVGTHPQWILVGICYNVMGGTVASVAVPIFILEHSVPEIEASMISMHGFCIQLGQFVIYASDISGNTEWFKYVVIVLIIVQLLLMCILPETPYFYIMQGDEEAAQRVLQFTRPADQVAAQFKLLKESLRKKVRTTSKKNNYLDYCQIIKETLKFKDNWTAIKATLVMQLISELSGFRVLTYYKPKIFDKAGCSQVVTKSFSYVLGSLGYLLNMIVIERWGSKTIVSTTITILGMVMMALAFTLAEHPIMALILLGVYETVYAQGILTMPWVINIQLFPLQYRGFGGAFAISMKSALNFFVSLFFSNFIDTIKPWALFVYSLLSFLGLFLIINYVPENEEGDVPENEKGEKSS